MLNQWVFKNTKTAKRYLFSSLITLGAYVATVVPFVVWAIVSEGGADEKPKAADRVAQLDTSFVGDHPFLTLFGVMGLLFWGAYRWSRYIRS